MKYEVLGSPPWHWASQCILILCECDESRDTNINIYNNLFDWSETLQTQSEEHIAASVTDCWQRRPRVKSLCRLHSSGRHRLANVQVVTRAMWGGYLTGRQSASSCAKTKLYRSNSADLVVDGVTIDHYARNSSVFRCKLSIDDTLITMRVKTCASRLY